MISFQELEARFRNAVDDEIGSDADKLWSQAEVGEFASDAQDELCAKALYISDSATAALNAYAEITLTGSTGSITSVVVNGVTITNATISYTTSLAVTAGLLAANINAYTSTPDYTAVASGPVVRIISALTTTAPNGYAVVTNTTGTLAANTVVLDWGGPLCSISATVGAVSYTHSPALLHVKDLRSTWHNYKLVQRDSEYLSRFCSNWRTLDGTPYEFCRDLGENTITLSRKPTATATLSLVVYRGPLRRVNHNDPASLLEVRDEHVPHLLNYMRYRAYSKNDAETQQEDKAAKYFKLWDRSLAEIKTQFKLRRLPSSVAMAPYAGTP